MLLQRDFHNFKWVCFLQSGNLKLQLNGLHWVCLMRSWQQGGCRDLREGRVQGLPHASPRELCSSPITAMAEPLSDDGGTTLQKYLRKGKTLPRQWGERTKSVSYYPAVPRGEKDEGSCCSLWTGHSGSWWSPPCSSHRTSAGAWLSCRKLQPTRRTSAGAGEIVRRKKH